MARWEPDAQGRLQLAAMQLFAERGYADVTVAEIADRAGLSKRTFFNHFADKREVLFAGAVAFEASVLAHLAAEPELPPLDAAVRALRLAGEELAEYGEYAAGRRALIASAPELQERDLIKLTALAGAIGAELAARGVPRRAATLVARAAVDVFTVAYDDWVDGAGDLEDLMAQALGDLRASVAG